MLEFFKENYMTCIVSAVYLLISIIYCILSIIKAFKNHKIKNFKELIEFIPIMINDAEELNLTGNQKFFYVLREIERICKSLNQKFDPVYFDELIESILSTPHKK